MSSCRTVASRNMDVPTTLTRGNVMGLIRATKLVLISENLSNIKAVFRRMLISRSANDVRLYLPWVRLPSRSTSSWTLDLSLASINLKEPSIRVWQVAYGRGESTVCIFRLTAAHVVRICTFLGNLENVCTNCWLIQKEFVTLARDDSIIISVINGCINFSNEARLASAKCCLSSTMSKNIFEPIFSDKNPRTAILWRCTSEMDDFWWHVVVFPRNLATLVRLDYASELT